VTYDISGETGRLVERGELDYKRFCELAVGAYVWDDAVWRSEEEWLALGGRQSSYEIIRACRLRLEREIVRGPEESQLPMIARLRRLRGGPDLLIAAARLHSERCKKALREQGYYPDDVIQAAIINMARGGDPNGLTKKTRKLLVDQLSTFPAKTLKCLLPFAPQARGPLLQALGWERAGPLADALFDFRDVLSARLAMEQAGDELSDEVIGLFASKQLNDSWLVQTIRGQTRRWIEKRLHKHNHSAIIGCGLLPLDRGMGEVLERYLIIRRFERESRGMGYKGRGSGLGSTVVAMSYLAQTAGFADTRQLEWAMEARLATGLALPRTWAVGEYDVEVMLDDVQPRLLVRRGERELSAIPKGVRDSTVYWEMRIAVDALRQQASRLRLILEQIMVEGESLRLEDRSALATIPIAQTLLECLVLFTEDGETGLFSGPEHLLLLDGTAREVRATARIAHPYDLLQSSQLGEWQQEIVRRRIVQPFKQVFRELYLLTPIERQTATYSTRFAGHAVESRVAASLLAGRGYALPADQDYHVSPFKEDPSLDIQAVIDFPDAERPILTMRDTITTGEVYFRVPDHDYRWPPRDETRLPLSEIPPLVFSETMRDVDLIVSVAEAGEWTDARLSPETYQRRDELVAALVDDLGIEGVKIEGHFAHVHGRLADYRVHLGSAAIHVEPGHHLCVVPKGWATGTKNLFLPFADSGDRQLAEVISKILLLVHDDKIEDQSILSQIKSLAR
jgi:Domain of unknown function (DUF4132)/Family of unknown function (DUF5724)